MLDGYLSTNLDNNYIHFELKEGSWESFKITSKLFESQTGATITERKVLGFLEEAEGNFQYKLEHVNYYQTQDLGHILLDITYTKTTLESDELLRRWLTIKAKNLTIVNNILVPRSKPANYVTLIPFGAFAHAPKMPYGYTFRKYRNGFANEKSMFITRPGKDVVYAMYSTPYFGRGYTAVARVNMKTGEIAFISPPTEIMNQSNSKFINSNAQNDPNNEYKQPLWMTSNEYKFPEYELFIHHSEKYNTYMTVASKRTSVDDLQLVMQNEKGEYVERMKKFMPINHYRVRDAKTHELISEYTLLNSTPIRTSWDGKYMFFAEGTNTVKVLTMRDRKTGKLINTGLDLDDHVSRRQIMNESKLGMLIMGMADNDLGTTFWEY